jgi:hypothetical protein
LSRSVLVDTGPIVAILLADDQYHGVCVAALRALAAPLLTCWPVLTEAAWLLRRRPTAVDRLLGSMDAGVFRLVSLDERDLSAIGAILTKYRTLGLQIADAALLHLANRESIDTVFTLDRRDFSAFRLRNGKRLRLIP